MKCIERVSTRSNVVGTFLATGIEMMVRNDGITAVSFKPQNNKKLKSHFEDFDFSVYEMNPKVGKIGNVGYRIPFSGKSGIQGSRNSDILFH